MADPNKSSEMTPEEAYKKLQEALKKGQAGLDALPEEVKELAMGPAADSVKDIDTPRPADMSETEGYTPIPGMTPRGLKEEPKKKSGERYSSFDPILPPPPPEESDFNKRQEYKGFRAPAGMNDEQMKAWKEGIDDRLLEKEDRLRERIESASPQDQVKDLLRRASEGDMEAIKDIGYFGLNVGSMVGPQQVASDLSLAGIDASRGDYVGAGIGVAAAGLPFVSTGMAKQILNEDFGEQAKDFFINYNQIGYEIDKALVESKGVFTDAIKELQEYREYLGNNVMKAIQDADDIAPMDAAKLDSSLLKATGKSLDEIIDSAKRNQRGK